MSIEGSGLLGGENGLHLCDRLYKFEPIAKRVSTLEAFEPWDRLAGQNLKTFSFERSAPPWKVIHFIGEMSFREIPCGIIFDTNVDLSVARLQPETSARLQGIGFFDLRQTEQPTIKSARLVLATWA